MGTLGSIRSVGAMADNLVGPMTKLGDTLSQGLPTGDNPNIWYGDFTAAI